MPTLLRSIFPFSVLINYKLFRLFQLRLEKSAELRARCPGERRRPIHHPLLISPSPLQNSTLSPSASPPTPPPLAQPSAGTAASFTISKLCIRRPWPSSLQLVWFLCVPPGHGLQTEPQRSVRGRARRLSGLAPG